MHLHRTFARALAAAATAAALLALTASPAVGGGSCTPTSSWATNRADLAAQVVTLVNAYRTSKGLSPLSSSAPLTASSAWKSMHMAAYGYFSHDDPAPPVARSAHQRALDCGYGGGWWGENIAYGYGSPQAVVDGWLGSPGHRANIENASFTSTGVGVAVNGSGRIYWTQSFGDDVAAASPSTPPPASSPASGSASSPSPSPSPPASPHAPAAGGQAAAGPGAAAPSAGESHAPSTAGVTTRSPRVRREQGGSRLVVTVAFVERATGKAVVSGSVRCRAEVGGRRLPVVANAFRGEAARCAWQVPAWAHGRHVTGAVAVRSGAVSAFRAFERTLG